MLNICGHVYILGMVVFIFIEALMKKISALFYLYIAMMTCFSSMSFANKSPVNIIFLLADDHRWDRFGFMGHKWLQTPHLDKLANDGVAFTQGYHAAPICKPARVSIMLGQHLNTHLGGFDKPSDWTVTYDEFNYSYPSLSLIHI